jgi:predicted transcriptional regulator
MAIPEVRLLIQDDIEAVWKCLETVPETTSDAVASITGIDKNVVQNAINILVSKGYLEWHINRMTYTIKRK